MEPTVTPNGSNEATTQDEESNGSNTTEATDTEVAEDSPGVDVWICSPGEGIGNALTKPIHLEGKVGETWSYDYPDTFTDENGKIWYNTYHVGNGVTHYSGTFTNELTYILNWYSDTPTVDEENRTILEQTVGEAKSYLDKDKYEDAYVDALDLAIKAGEQALIDNPQVQTYSIAPMASTGHVFQPHIDAINKAVEDVKAHPVSNPAEESGGAFLVFTNEVGFTISDKTVEKHGKVGDKYEFTKSELPTSLSFGGKTYVLDEDYLATVSLTGTLEKDAKFINIHYKQGEAPTPEPEQQATIDINWVNQDGDSIKEAVQIEGKVGDNYDLSDYAVAIDGYQLDKDKMPTLTGVLKENLQVTFHYNAISNSGTGNNNDTNNGGANSTNTSDSANKGTNIGNNSASTSKTDALPKTGETDNPWFTLAGLSTIATTTLAWFFKRKRV